MIFVVLKLAADVRQASAQRLPAPSLLLWLLFWLVASFALAACAPRPGPEVLNVAPMAKGARIVKIYVATTRERADPNSNAFTNDRSRQLNYAEFHISIPPNHREGEIEWPKAKSDASREFVIVKQEVLDRATFEARTLNRTDGKRVGVFVHGFNTTFQEGLFRLAQMSADIGIYGAPILFSWPSEGSVTSYLADKESVTASRDRLADLFDLLTRRQEVTVLAHSMGGWLTVETLRQLRLSGKSRTLERLTVILASPDIDEDVFRSQMEVIGRMPKTMVLLVTDDDLALKISSRLAGGRRRAGVLDVRDPKVREAAIRSNVEIVDMTALGSSDSIGHSRFANSADIYRTLVGHGSGKRQHRAGAFLIGSVGDLVTAPLRVFAP